MPNNWKTYKLSQVTTKIGSGSTPRGGQEAYKASGTSLIRSQNILDFTFSTNGLAFIDDVQASKLNNVTLEEDDVLLNITGDSVARVCQVPKKLLPARVNQHVAIIRANKEKLNSTFLKYSLLETSNKNALLNMASAGATRQAITKSMIEGFELKLPPLQEQQSIASILSAIDDKIENNLAINKTLEEMAMALYKHWFVDFGPFQDGEFIESELGMIPKGWEVKSIEDLLSIKPINGLYKKSEYQGFGNRWLKMSSVYGLDLITNQKMDLISVTDKEIQNFGCLKDDIVFGRTSLVLEGIGKCAIIKCEDDIPIFESNLFRIRLNKDLVYPDIIYMFFKSQYGRDEVKKLARQTAAVSITSKDLTNIKIALPSILVQNEVAEKLDFYINKQIENIKENQTLTQLRDTLLPQLISGAVRLKEFRE